MAKTVAEYEKELTALTEKIDGGLTSGTKLMRIIARRNDICDGLIPELKGVLVRAKRKRVRQPH